MEGKRKPIGGFVFVSATGLLAAWWAYKRGRIEFRDFRVWLASHELVAQRCGMERGRQPRYQTEELDALVGGVGGQHHRCSIRRLESAGLLRWSESGIEAARSLDEVKAGEGNDLAEFVDAVTNHKRRIPVPRRLLRMLAGEGRPVLVATALGHLLRCMYYRKGKCEPAGLCKASWIATTLEVDERNVKAARRELEARGLLIRGIASQYRLNRWGVPMRFNLDWAGAKRQTESPPRVRRSTTETPPPRETGNSSSGRSRNQKPALPRSGVRKRTGKGPRLAHVVDRDLTEPPRLLELYLQAVEVRLVGKAEAERLKFFAAAEHARRHARKNAPGLFVSVVRRGLWGYLSLDDEDAGRRALRGLPGPAACTVAHRAAPRSVPEEPRDLVRRRVAASLGLAPGDSAASPPSRD